MRKTLLHAPAGLILLVVSLIWAIPARPAAADREHLQIIADIRMLQEQAQQLQALLNGLGDALKALNTRLDEQTALERKAFADGKVQTDGISSDIRVVREKADETNVRLGSLQQELESLRDALPQPGVQAPAPTTSDAAPLPDGTVPAPPAAATSAPPGISPDRLWSTSYGDYSTGNYSLAIPGFESYLRYFPKGAKAADCQLYIGQSYEADNKLNDAITAYDRVIANYSTSTEQAATAYFKRGMVLQQLGQIDRARQSYEAAVSQYPTAASTTLAKQRLVALSAPAR